MIDGGEQARAFAGRNSPLRAIDLEDPPAPTHQIRRAVTAWRICAMDEIASHRRVTVIADGEPAHVEVPADFCRPSTPVAGDWLVVNVIGEVGHLRADVFADVATPLPRARSGPFEMPPRAPHLPA